MPLKGITWSGEVWRPPPPKNNNPVHSNIHGFPYAWGSGNGNLSDYGGPLYTAVRKKCNKYYAICITYSEGTILGYLG